MNKNYREETVWMLVHLNSLFLYSIVVAEQEGKTFMALCQMWGLLI